MLNGIAVKVIKKLRDWIVPNEIRNFGISEKIIQRTSIKNLPQSDDISLSFIDFSFESITPKERQISGRVFLKCLFSHEVIENFTFQDCTFINCTFNGAMFLGTEFHDCEFRECLFYKAKFNNTYIDPATFHFSKKWHWISANVNSGLFQSLYNNSKTMHQEKFAMRADRRFQFYRRYQYLYGDSPAIRSFLRALLFDYLLGYGYGIKNSLVVTLASILGFAWILDDKIVSEKGTFLEAIYFTVVSLTTVGYGEITPRNEVVPLAITIMLLLLSIAWCAVVTAIIVKRIVK